jgi:acetylornithine deacetylase/succinyl-diaminopimelate desuccinylase-like protein
MLVDIVEGGSVRENVIATQGSGKDFVLWVTGHMDTIQPKDDWPENARATARTLMQKGDKLSGLGVFDMKAGLWQMLELARTCNVPQGMTVVYLFLVDEERDSKGMLAALRAVGGGTIPMPHFVISPEISVRASTSRGKRFTNSRSVPVVTGRRGNITLNVQVTTPSGHGGRKKISTNALDALMEHRSLMSDDFKGNKDVLLGREELVERGVHSSGFGELSTLSVIDYQYSVMTVSPADVQTVVDREIARHESIANAQKYARQGITVAISEFRRPTHYQPYVMRGIDPQLRSVEKAIKDVGVRYNTRLRMVTHGDGSTSDMNLVASRGYHGLEISPRGGLAHNPGEFVLSSSVVRNLEIFRHLIENGLLQGKKR